MTGVDIDAIRTRLKAASPAPWSVNMIALTIWNARSGLVADVFACDERAAECDATAQLLVHAPTDLAALCDEVERLRALCARESAALDALDERLPCDCDVEPHRCAAADVSLTALRLRREGQPCPRR